jgi:hypothetical protein
MVAVTSASTEASFSIAASSSSSRASRTSRETASDFCTRLSLSERSFMSFWELAREKKSGSPERASISSMRFFRRGTSKMPPEVLGPAGELL